MYQNYVIQNIGRQAHLEVASIYFTVKLSRVYANDANTSVISSSAPPPQKTVRHLLTLSVSAGGAFTILLRPGGWAFPYLRVTPGHLTHMFLKVPWKNSLAKTRHLLKIS